MLNKILRVIDDLCHITSKPHKENDTNYCRTKNNSKIAARNVIRFQAVQESCASRKW